MFISEPINGFYYFAERSPLGHRRFIWSTMPVEPTAADAPIDASRVPWRIRRQAYRKFYQEHAQMRRSKKTAPVGANQRATGAEVSEL